MNEDEIIPEETPEEEEKFHCDCCSSEVDGVTSTSEGNACTSCLEDFSSCNRCGEYFLSENMDCHNHDSYCESCYRLVYFRCSHCDISRHNDEYCTLPDGQNVCSDCFGEVTCTCEGCGNTIWNDDAIYDNDDGPYCSHCQTPYEPKHSQFFSKNPYKRMVGFELEFFVKGDISKILSYGKLHDDGSLKLMDFTNDYCSYEFSSEPYNGDRLLETIEEVCNIIQRADGAINSSCGFHVHLDMSKSNGIQRENIRNWWRIFEPLFFGMTSESRRGNSYCHYVGDKSDCDWRENRYTTLNISAIEKYETYEFRLHQGTIDPIKIKNWIILLLDFVETFKDIESSEKRYQDVLSMTERERLIFFFLQTGTKLKKYMIKRLRKFQLFYKSPFLGKIKTTRPTILKATENIHFTQLEPVYYSWSNLTFNNFYQNPHIQTISVEENNELNPNEEIL